MVVTVQDGWMKCVACSDADSLHKGQMYLLRGIYMPCAVCNGKGEVPHYKLIDVKTGRRVDPETLTERSRHGP